MKCTRVFTLLAFFTLSLTTSAQTLAKFDFQNAPYVQAPEVDENISVSDFSISSGSIAENKTTGDYFPQEPYVEATSWKDADLASARYFFFDIKPDANVEATFTKVSFSAYRTSTGPSKIALLVGDELIEERDFLYERDVLRNFEFVFSKTISTETRIKIAGWGGTSSSGPFRIDDVLLEGTSVIIPDETPPTVVSVEVLNKQTLQVNYSEPVQPSTAESLSAYNVSNNTISDVTFSDTEKMVVKITCADPFADSQQEELTIRGIKDLAGNSLDGIFEKKFTYYALKLSMLKLIDEKSVDVYYNFEPDVVSATNIANYFVDQSVNNPLSAEQDDENPLLFHLTFSKTFPANQTLSLTADVKDQSADLHNFTKTFVYGVAQYGEVVFSEVMADYSPAPAYLPEARYIELYNNSQNTIDLTDWKMVFTGVEKEFDGGLISPQSHIIICDEANAEVFVEYGSTATLSLSSLSSEEELLLYNPQGNLISRFAFTKASYLDEEKSNGGWSLERIDVANSCAEAENWAASEDYRGGTPGMENSVTATISDNVSPELDNIEAITSLKLLLHFNEAIDSTQHFDTDNFFVDNNVGNPLWVSLQADKRSVLLGFETQFPVSEPLQLIVSDIADWCGNNGSIEEDFEYKRIYIEEYLQATETSFVLTFSEPVDASTCVTENFEMTPDIGQAVNVWVDPLDPARVHVTFASGLSDGVSYTLNIQGVNDQNTNTMQTTTFDFFSHKPSANEVVINEVLIYPNSGEKRFVELYNRSSFPINLKDLQFVEKENGEITDVHPLSETDQYLAPASYLAITEDVEVLKNAYNTQGDESLWEVKSLPAYDKSEALVSLYNTNGETIDEFRYSSDMQLSLLADKGRGVSLERLNPSAATNDANNWQSAASSVGFATPGYQNSQYREAGEPSGTFTLSREIFSPDNDGEDDFLLIEYKTDGAENVANVTIYDGHGRKIRRLANNELMAAEGHFKWDGTDDGGKKAAIGIYIVFIEWFDTNGDVQKEKLSCVVAGHLK